MKPNKTIKHSRYLKWTYQGRDQAKLLALAMLGQSNLVIRSAVGFSEHEVNYALTKAQDKMKLKGGFRRNWANGKSEVAQQVVNDLTEVLVKDIQRKLPTLIIHPEPKFIKVP